MHVSVIISSAVVLDSVVLVPEFCLSCMIVYNVFNKFCLAIFAFYSDLRVY